ncbi:MAG: SDR family NAD(P)-dependent oxidoreductase, partial [Anaerolineaceae bacterium]|nr:SDR family NAD(P)-dependent oxidoreductase [Anaerolineaceae bacterium]
MNLELTNKIAFVTGASSGIGAAVARVLAEEGADVVVSFGHDEAGARKTAQGVEAKGCHAWLSQMDISDPIAINKAVEQVKTQVEGIDILILCAGQNFVTPWMEIKPEEWNQIMKVNLNGPFHVMQGLVPNMREGGSIVTVASVAGQTGTPKPVHYAAAKAGLVNLTKSLARDLAPRIRVNCVAPGITITPMGEDTISSLTPNYAEKKIPVQRYA